MPPDDEKDQVAEQEEVDEFDAAFAEETDETEGKSAKSDETDEESEESDESESESEETEEQEEEDDLISRGKELLTAEEEREKAEKEAKEKADQAAAAAKQKAEEDAVKPINEADIKALAGMIKPTDFPEEVEVNGVTFNTREFLEDNPESTVIAGLAAARTLERMTKNGVIFTAQQVEQKLKEQQDLIWGNTFAAMVSMWHGDAEKLVQSQEFSQWLDGSPKELQTLWKSGNPIDAIEIINRYKEDVITKEDGAKQKETESEAKKKAKSNRERHEKLHRKTTPKKPAIQPTIAGLEDLGNIDDDFAAGFNED